MKRVVIYVLFFLSVAYQCDAQTTLVFQDQQSKEPVCNVYVSCGSQKIFSDCNGVAVITEVNSTIQVRHVSYRDTAFTTSEKEQVILLQTVSFSSPTVYIRRRQNTDKIYIPAKQLETIPYLLGQRDVMSYVQTLPGVSNAQEGNTGLNVRGGRADETLILLDDAPIYNPNHVFGLFSSFNPGVVKSIDFYKDRMPSEYGGRNAGVLAVHTKNGDFHKRNLEANVSLLGADISSDGYLIKDKLSYNIGGRASYTNLIKYFTPDLEAGYYDVNTKLTYKLSDKEYLSASFYTSRDRYAQSDNNQNIVLFFNQSSWSNTAASLKWYKTMDNGWNMKAVYSLSRLENEKASVYENVSTFDTYQEMNVHHAKGVLSKNWGKWNVNYGAETSIYSSNSVLRDRDTSFAFIPQTTSTEIAAFGEVSYAWQNWRARVGTRVNGYISENKNYIVPDVRGLLSKSWGSNSAYLAIDRTSQFVFQLYETFMPIASDFWITANDKLGPQISNMISIGYDGSYKKLNYGVGAYAKRYEGAVDYADGAVLYSDSDYSQYLEPVDRQSAGVEFNASYVSKRISLDANYTLSKTTLQGETINRGERYPAFYDRPHLLNAGFTYKSGKKFSFIARQYLSSGRNMTVTHLVPFSSLTSSRNAVRLPLYHRLDVSFNWDYQNKKHPNRSSRLSVSVYNAYNNLNTYFIGISYENESPYGEYDSVTLFPIIPSISYGVKF
jgi:hypothetical protein